MAVEEVYAEDVDWHDTARALQQEVTRLMRRIDELRPLAAQGVRNADLEQQLRPLCECVDAPMQECPLHGDGEAFVAMVQQLLAVATRARRVDRGVIQHIPGTGRDDLAADTARFILGGA